MSLPITLRSFAHFTKLSIELQNLIWQITLSRTRAFNGDSCFQEWWYGRIVPFLSAVALHVCCSSRFLAKRVLRCTPIHIPGLRGWRTLHFNQACDYLNITKRDLQMNRQFRDYWRCSTADVDSPFISPP